MSTSPRFIPQSLLAGLIAFSPVVLAGPSIDDLLADFDESTPGVLIGVVRGGELTETGAAGMADLRFAVPLQVGTLTNIGSTAKQFTGMALALLHERGELSLDDDVRKHIPELPEFEHTVSLRHLLSHTSGYREFINAEALAGVRIEKGDWMDGDAVIATVARQTELQNQPGGEWNYNNTGYGLLAEVVTRVTGTPFQDWVGEEIFQPLGMNNSHFRLQVDQIIANTSRGYTRGDAGYLEARDVGGALGAGGVYTSLDDMATWMAHLGRFELGGESVRDLMTTPFELNNGESTGYGLGLTIDEFRGLERWQHGGGDIGHQSVFDYFPEHDVGYMIFANHHGIDADFVHALAEIVLGDHLAARQSRDETSTEGTALSEPAEFSDELFDRYTGRYELEVAPGFIMRFFRDEGRYMIQASGQPAVEIQPLSANTFTQDEVGARFVFLVEDNGKVGELTLHQNGEHRAVRVEDDQAAEEKDLSDYVGRYLSPELETFYTLALTESGELELRHRRFKPITLHHASAERFNGAFPVANIEFTRDEDGQVTGLKAGNGRARGIAFERVE